MKQIGFLIFLIAVLLAGYIFTIPIAGSPATMFFGVGLICFAIVGRITLANKT